MTPQELIDLSKTYGWKVLQAITGENPFIILKKGKYELWVEGDLCNILEDQGDSLSIGMGSMFLSHAKVNPDSWIIGLFGPIVERWFSLEDCRFFNEL